MVADLISEIEEEGRRKREGDPVAGVEAILSQDPYEVPTRQPKAVLAAWPTRRGCWRARKFGPYLVIIEPDRIRLRRVM